MRTVLAFVVAAAVVASAGCGDESSTDEASPSPVTTAPSRPAEEAPSSPPADEPATGATVEFTIVDLVGYAGGDLAGVVTRDVDGLVVGGFATRISDDLFATTQLLRLPAAPDEPAGAWPHVTDEQAVLPPGEYVLTLWVDTGLGAYTRWFPLNTDARGLAGCVHAFAVGDEPHTSVVIGGDVRSTGYVGVCESDAAAATGPPGSDGWGDLPTAMDPVTGLDAGRSVRVTVSGVTDHAGHELAGVLYAGGELLDLDDDALGGFWAAIDGDDFTTTEVIRAPSADLVGRFPFVSDEAVTVDPGTYTLVVWVDHGLGGFERWVPVNSDGRGLFGCHYSFDVGTESQTAITVPANLRPDGWNVDCVTGAVTPGTDAAAAVAPPDLDPWEHRPTTMGPVTGLDQGPSLRVTVSGVSGRLGDEFAAVLYEGGDLSDLDREALGGFWAVISSDDQTLAEVVRRPGELGVGPFPYLSDEALTVGPGTYTLVLWVDETLDPVSRWVPINTYVPGDPLTEGMDLYSCHMVVDVGDDPLTDVEVPANLQHNGWNVDCVTGRVIPGTDAASAVSPYGSP